MGGTRRRAGARRSADPSNTAASRAASEMAAVRHPFAPSCREAPPPLSEAAVVFCVLVPGEMPYGPLALTGLRGPVGGVPTGSTRHYSRFTDVISDMIEARILGGLHFRRADVNGAILGQSVADFVDRNFFNCRPPGQCRQERRE